MLQPYEYNKVKQEITRLIDIYKTVNDKQVIKTSQLMVTNTIETILGVELHEKIYSSYMDTKLTNSKAENLFTIIKADVVPFPLVSDSQVKKSFKKVKKMTYPKLDEYDLQETTYLAWNDIGAQRKYVVFYRNGKLVGLSGTMSPQVKKNVCTICHTISNVSMFLTTTKSAGDGTYTKKGNYICVDSEECNKRLNDLTHLYDFYDTISH
ncbi:FusB/FusC family EF-G-binding protein [Vagococcus sp. JNUCC 83]